MPEATEETRRGALSVMEAFESAAFRTAQVTRQLLAEHPELPVWRIRPYAVGYQDPAAAHAKLEISAGDVEGVRAWAEALGTTVDRSFFDTRGSGQPFEHHEALATVTGVEVIVIASRRDLSPDEIAVWRAQQAQGGGR